MFRTVNHIHLQSKHPLFMFTRSPPTRRMDGDAAVLLVPYGRPPAAPGPPPIRHKPEPPRPRPFAVRLIFT